jgi:hypothetical protein
MFSTRLINSALVSEEVVVLESGVMQRASSIQPASLPEHYLLNVWCCENSVVSDLKQEAPYGIFCAQASWRMILVSQDLSTSRFDPFLIETDLYWEALLAASEWPAVHKSTHPLPVLAAMATNPDLADFSFHQWTAFPWEAIARRTPVHRDRDLNTFNRSADEDSWLQELAGQFGTTGLLTRTRPTVDLIKQLLFSDRYLVRVGVDASFLNKEVERYSGHSVVPVGWTKVRDTEYLIVHDPGLPVDPFRVVEATTFQQAMDAFTVHGSIVDGARGPSFPLPFANSTCFERDGALKRSVPFEYTLGIGPRHFLPKDKELTLNFPGTP